MIKLLSGYIKTAAIFLVILGLTLPLHINIQTSLLGRTPSFPNENLALAQGELSSSP